MLKVSEVAFIGQDSAKNSMCTKLLGLPEKRYFSPRQPLG